MNQNLFFRLLWVVLLIMFSSCVPATPSPTADPTTPVAAKVLAEWQVNMPVKMAFDANSVWVPSHRDPNVITRIDQETNQIIATIDGISYQSHQAIVVGNSIWVTGWGLNEIDTKTNTIISTIQKTEHYSFAAYGFESLWAANGSDRLDRIDPTTSQIVDSIELGDGRVDCINDVFVTDSAVWVDHCDETELIKIDPATNGIVSKIPYETLVNQAKSATDIPSGNGSDFLWIQIIPGGLLRIDPNTATGRTFLPLSPEQFNAGPLTITDTTIWVCGFGQIIKVDVATNQIVATYQTDDKGSHYVGVGFGSVWIGYENTRRVQRWEISP